jgi:hypothetical protein
MTLQAKQNIWGAALLAGFFVLLFAAAQSGSPAFLAGLGAWFLILGVLQFRWFRCPSCGELAIRTPTGLYVPNVGTKCRHCGNSY